MAERQVALAALVLTAVLLPGGVHGALSQADPGARTQIGDFYIGVGLMDAGGDGGFRISGNDTIVGRFSSQLEFPMDATYLVLEAGIDRLGPGFGLHLRYGTSTTGLDGTAIDTDYAWEYDTDPFIRSLADSDGDSVFLTLDASYRLFEGAIGEDAADGTAGSFDVFAGYHMQDSTFEIRDVRTVIADFAVASHFVPGKAATYDMEFYGLRVGVRGELRFGRASTVSGSLAVLPFVWADGFGQWIVREKTLDHNATGWGLDLLVRYEYALTPSVRLWVGAGLTRLKGTDGTDTQFRFSGRPIGQSRLDELESDYSFLMIGGEFRF